MDLNVGGILIRVYLSLDPRGGFKWKSGEEGKGPVEGWEKWEDLKVLRT